MRPLTLRRLFLECSILVLILFVVVVIAVKFGAVLVSLYALGRDLWHVLLGQRADLHRRRHRALLRSQHAGGLRAHRQPGA